MKKRKTNKTALKRFKVTKKGKLLRRKQGISHLKRKETQSSKKRKSRLERVTGTYAKKILKII